MADDKRSSLWNTAAGASLLGGAGVGIYSQRKDIVDLFTTGRKDIVGQTANIASNLPKFQTSSRFSTMSSSADLSKTLMSIKLNTAGNVGTDLKHLAYRSIMAGGQTSHKNAIQAIQFLDMQGGPADTLQAAASVISKYKGDTSVFESGLRSIGSTEQAGLLKDAAISPGGMIGKTNFFRNKSGLNRRALEKFHGIQKNLAQAAGGLDLKVNWQFINVEDLHPSGFGKITTPMAIGEIAGTKFNIPLANTGFTYGGKNLTSRYITRQGYTPAGDLLNFTDLYSKKVGDVIRSSKTSSALKQNLMAATRELIDITSPGSAAIWSQSAYSAGGMAKARLITQEAIPMESMSPDDIPKMFSKGFFPYTSPDPAGKGVLATRDLARSLYGDLGLLMSAEKRPTQFIRPEWSTTAEAKQIARSRPFKGTFGGMFSRFERKIQGPAYKRFLYGGVGNLGKSQWDPSVYTTPQLMTFYAKPAAGGVGVGYRASALDKMISPEEGVIGRRAAQMLEHQRVVEKRILLNEGMRVNERILSAVKGKAPSAAPIMFDEPIGLGKFVGIEAGTGREITTTSVDALQDVIGVQILDDNEAKVLIRERHKLSPNKMWKFFSEENKFMAASADPEKMSSVLRAAGLGDIRRVAGQEIEAVFSAKLIGKNKMAQINQQIEAAAMFIGYKMDQGGVSFADTTMTGFLQDPAAALNIRSIMESGADDASVQVQKNLLGLTRQAGFSKWETQLTFGMMSPDVAARLEEETGFRGFAKMVERAPGVVGVGKGRLGDLAAGGAGGRGSIESSSLRLITMKGDIGQRYAGELAGRVVGRGEYSAANKMLASVLGQEDIISKTKRFGTTGSFTGLNLSELGGAGQYVDLGRKFKELGGSSALYLPGIDEATGLLSPNLSPKGDLIDTPIMAELKSLQRMLRDRTASEIELEQAAASLRNVVAQESAAQIAIKKGKIIGSKLLTGYRHSFEDAADAFVISPKMAEGMFSDLIERATTEEQVGYLTKQRERAMAGKAMVGGMWRHPTTGPESFQFVRYKVDKRVADGMVAAPTKFGKLQFAGGTVQDIDISEMVGFKGDFDRDQYVISAMSNKATETRVAKMIGGQRDKEYTKYLFNHYAMKDAIESRLSKSEVLGMQDLTTGFRQLTTAKTTTGQVNMALQRLKIGLQYSAPEQYRPLAEMFYHLEEAAIGGKHGVLNSVLYRAIAESTKQGGEAGTQMMEQVITSIMGAEPREISGEITNQFGQVSAHKLKYDPKKWAQIAISSHDAVKDDVNIAMRTASRAAGRQVGDIQLNKLVEEFYARQFGNIDVSQSMMQSIAEGNTFTSKAGRTIRRGATKARGLLNIVSKAKGPAIIGGAVAAGIMMAAPNTTAPLPASLEGAAGGRNMSYEDYGPPGGPGMDPPSPGQNIAPSVYDTGGARPIVNANIRMRIDDLNSNSRDFMRSAREMSNGNNVNIRTRDDRSILDPRSLASKIHERL